MSTIDGSRFRTEFLCNIDGKDFDDLLLDFDLDS